MFPILRRHWMLWTAWMLSSCALLFANPWIAFGWAELAAGLGSLLIAVDRRIRREGLLVAGLLAIALLATADSTPVSAARLLVDAFVFVGAVLLGARAVDDQIELEDIAGHLALGPDPSRAYLEFRRAVEREIARARRHDRSFVLLSMAPARGARRVSLAERLGGTFGGSSEGSARERVAEQIVEARALLEVADLLAEEVHLYAEVVPTQDRVLCLVPEVEATAVAALDRRLRKACLERLGLEVASGIALFPRDALGVDDLIEVADAARRPVRLETLSGPTGVAREAGVGAALRDSES